MIDSGLVEEGLIKDVSHRLTYMDRLDPKVSHGKAGLIFRSSMAFLLVEASYRISKRLRPNAVVRLSSALWLIIQSK